MTMFKPWRSLIAVAGQKGSRLQGRGLGYPVPGSQIVGRRESGKHANSWLGGEKESKKDYRQPVGTLFRNNQMVINSGIPTVNCRK